MFHRMVVFVLLLGLVAPVWAQDDSFGDWVMWADDTLGNCGVLILPMSFNTETGEYFSVGMSLMLYSLASGLEAIELGAEDPGTAFRFWNTLIKACDEKFDNDALATAASFAKLAEDRIREALAEENGADVKNLTVNDEVWDAPNGEERLVAMVVSDDPYCYKQISWGRDKEDSLSERMRWRQEFINDCI